MQSALYVGLSGQVALEKRLATIANNVANINTAAFHPDAVKFEAVLSKVASGPAAFSTPGENIITRHAGAMTKTGNPLDVGVAGSGWLAFAGPAGPVYTRDGRMQMTAAGDLQTLEGYPVLDPGGAQIMLDPNAGPPVIARDGTITQDRVEMGTIGMFSIPPEAKLQRFGNSGVIPDRMAPAILDFVSDGLQQGFTEGSGVNPMLEMTRLILASRAFEGTSSLVESTENTLQNAIRTLGEPAKA